MEANDHNLNGVRTKVLELIVSQLQSYGYYQLASVVQDEAGLTETLKPSSLIEEKLFEGLVLNPEDYDTAQNAVKTESIEEDEEEDGDIDLDKSAKVILNEKYFVSVDDDNDDINTTSMNTDDHEVPRLTNSYTTVHRGPSLVTSYSLDGRFIASGSTDMSIKVIDVEKIKSAYGNSSDIVRPVIRTLYDHSAPINDVKFHPNGTVVASASDDGNIKIFDVLKVNSKKSFRYIQDATQIKTLSFHPSGDFLAVGTIHPVLRVYDVHTLKCFAVADRNSNHTGAINTIDYSKNGRIIVSGSSDGTVKLWDAIAGKCIHTIDKPHQGLSVTSVCFSKNGKELLTTGKDGISRLWDLYSELRCLTEYLPSGSVDNNTASIIGNSQFTYDETFITGIDISTNSLGFWNKYTGKLERCFSDGSEPITYVAASPTEFSFSTCSQDAKVRYWGVV